MSLDLFRVALQVGEMLSKLKVYTDDQHPHQAQKPEPIELGVKKKTK